MTSGRGTKWAEVLDVRWEQEHVRKILASAAALKGETIQSEWNEDDYDFSDDDNEDGKDQDCPQEPGWTIVDAGMDTLCVKQLRTHPGPMRLKWVIVYLPGR